METIILNSMEEYMATLKEHLQAHRQDLNDAINSPSIIGLVYCAVLLSDDAFEWVIGVAGNRDITNAALGELAKYVEEDE